MTAVHGLPPSFFVGASFAAAGTAHRTVALILGDQAGTTTIITIIATITITTTTITTLVTGTFHIFPSIVQGHTMGNDTDPVPVFPTTVIQRLFLSTAVLLVVFLGVLLAFADRTVARVAVARQQTTAQHQLPRRRGSDCSPPWFLCRCIFLPIGSPQPQRDPLHWLFAISSGIEQCDKRLRGFEYCSVRAFHNNKAIQIVYFVICCTFLGVGRSSFPKIQSRTSFKICFQCGETQHTFGIQRQHFSH